MFHFKSSYYDVADRHREFASVLVAITTHVCVLFEMHSPLLSLFLQAGNLFDIISMRVSLIYLALSVSVHFSGVNFDRFNVQGRFAFDVSQASQRFSPVQIGREVCIKRPWMGLRNHLSETQCAFSLSEVV